MQLAPAAARAAASAPRASPSARLDARADRPRGCRPTARSADRWTRPARPRPFTSATTVSSRPVSGALSPVPKIASTMRSQSSQLGRSAAPSSSPAISTTGRPEAPEDLEVDARVAPHVGERRRARTRRRRRRAAAACARRRSRRRRCCRGPPAPPRGVEARSSKAASMAPRPGGRRSPSARATEMPISSIVRRSASRIWSAFSTLMVVSGSCAA